jgi:hypothetical protein
MRLLYYLKVIIFKTNKSASRRITYSQRIVTAHRPLLPKLKDRLEETPFDRARISALRKLHDVHNRRVHGR